MLQSISVRFTLYRFLKSWIEYRDVMLGRNPEPRGTRSEEDFLKLQAKLAAHLQVLEDSVPGTIGAEAHREFGAITGLLKENKSLSERDAWTDADREGFERKWHEQYIWLNKLKGAALRRKDSIPKPKLGAHVPNGLNKSWVTRRYHIARPIRSLFGFAFFLLVVYVISWGMGVRWQSGGGFAADESSKFGGALANVYNAFYSVWLHIAKFFAPVVEAYGLGWTLILFGLLFLAGAYWINARG